MRIFQYEAIRIDGGLSNGIIVQSEKEPARNGLVCIDTQRERENGSGGEWAFARVFAQSGIVLYPAHCGHVVFCYVSNLHLSARDGVVDPWGC